MANTKIIGNAVVITTAVAMEDLEKLKKYHPETLQLTKENPEGKPEQVFALNTGESVSINKHGIQFNAQNTGGKATATVMIPAYVEDKVQWVKDELGVAILNLNVMEDQIENALLNLAEHFQAVEENIEVIE